jgi:hypothetical protein
MTSFGPTEYVARFTASEMLGNGYTWFTAGRDLGEPDALCRRGVSETKVWRVERVTALRLGEVPFTSPAEPLELITLPEAARLAGLTYGVAQTRLPAATSFLIHGRARVQLWPREYVVALRRMIRAGQIKVQARSLRRVADNVHLCAPIHRNADMSQELVWRDRNKPRSWRVY